MFKTITDDAKLPVRAERYSAGFDVFANEDTVISAGDSKLVKLGIVIDLDFVAYEIAKVDVDAGGRVTGGDSAKAIDFLQSHYLELYIDISLSARGLISTPQAINIDNTNEIEMMVYNPVKDWVCDLPLGVATNMELAQQQYKKNSHTINKGDKVGQLIIKRHEGYLLPYKYSCVNMGTELKK